MAKKLKKGATELFNELKKIINEIFESSEAYLDRREKFGEEVGDQTLTPSEKRYKDRLKAKAKRIEKRKARPKRKQVYRKYASKFDKKFHLRFDGEIRIRKFGNNEEMIELVGAHNHDVLGSKIQLGEIRKPQGVSFNDFPRCAFYDKKQIKTVKFYDANL